MKPKVLFAIMVLLKGLVPAILSAAESPAPTLFSMDQLLAPMRSSTQPGVMLDLDSSKLLKISSRKVLKSGSVEPVDIDLLVTLHRRRTKHANIDAVSIYRRLGDRYQRLWRQGSEKGLDTFDLPNTFKVGENTFLHIRRTLSGTGSIQEDSVYSLSSDGKLLALPIDNGRDKCSAFYKRDEVIYKGPWNEFHDNDMHFWFPIWRKGDPNASSSVGDAIHGTFAVEGDFNLATRSNIVVPEFRIKVASCRRVKQD